MNYFKKISRLFVLLLLIVLCQSTIAQNINKNHDFSRGQFKKSKDAIGLRLFLLDSASQISETIQRIYTTDGKSITIEDAQKATEESNLAKIKQLKGASTSESLEKRTFKSQEEIGHYILDKLTPDRAIIQSKNSDNTYQVKLLELKIEEEI